MPLKHIKPNQNQVSLSVNLKIYLAKVIKNEGYYVFDYHIFINLTYILLFSYIISGKT